MRTVIQRVTHASVTVDQRLVGQIKQGLLVLVGVEDIDTEKDIVWLSNKLVNLRIFEDEQGVMNQSVEQINGEILLVSQFTLHAMTKKGNRPSYIKAAKGEFASMMIDKLADCLVRDLGKPIARGVFGADMKIELLNDGPVTICIDTQNRE